MKKEIKFIFDNPEAAEHFLTWLCESGEQEYWQWMEVRESEEDGNITAVKFDYHNGGTKAEDFGSGDIITTCGRLDED